MKKEKKADMSIFKYVLTLINLKQKSKTGTQCTYLNTRYNTLLLLLLGPFISFWLELYWVQVQVIYLPFQL